MVELVVASLAFTMGQPIPKKYTCEGLDVSPAITWGKVPESTKSMAVICDDPDAPLGIWVHWVIFNIPPSANGLPEGVPASSSHLIDGSIQGVNSSSAVGYSGPCPPPGKPHRYYFKVYALDVVLQLKERALKKDLESAMQGHVLGKGELMGTYRR